MCVSERKRERETLDEQKTKVGRETGKERDGDRQTVGQAYRETHRQTETD